MAAHATHKDTAAARAQTLAHRQARIAKTGAIPTTRSAHHKRTK